MCALFLSNLFGLFYLLHLHIALVWDFSSTAVACGALYCSGFCAVSYVSTKPMSGPDHASLTNEVGVLQVQVQ